MINIAIFSFSKKNILWLIIPIVLILSTLPFCFKKKLILFPDNPNLIQSSYIATEKSYTDILFPSDLEFDNYFNTPVSKEEDSTINHYGDTIKSYTDILFKNIKPSLATRYQWNLKQDTHWFDIRGYDHLILIVDSSSTDKVVNLILHLFIDNFSKTNDRQTWQPLLKEVSLTQGKRTYSIPLEQFKTPHPWFLQYKEAGLDLKKTDWSKLGIISLEIGSYTVGNSTPLLIDSLYFEKKQGSTRAILLLSIVALLCIWFLSIMWIQHTLTQQNDPVVIPYKKLPLENTTFNEEKKILDFLGNNFSNSMLSLSFISNQLNIPGTKISAIIKSQFNLSFPQYLNTIRITEAKRLLQETTLQIKRIGKEVGYSNSTHFCRAFKEITGQSPNSFRQKSNEISPAKASSIETETI